MRMFGLRSRSFAVDWLKVFQFKVFQFKRVISWTASEIFSCWNSSLRDLFGVVD